jgi:hypothetical protein
MILVQDLDPDQSQIKGQIKEDENKIRFLGLFFI